MKKIIAIALATMMLLGCAVFASAAETTLPDQTFAGWWTAFSQGIPVTEEGFTLTFDVKSENATANYHSPTMIVHAGSAEAIGTEYWAQRGDAWGWLYGENVGDHAAALQEKGYVWEFLFAEGFNWDNFVPTLVAGTPATVTAKLEGTNVLLTYELCGVTNKVTIPVDAANPIFLTITGENTSISNVKVVTPDPAPEGLTALLKFADTDFVPATAGVCPTVIDGAGTYTLSVENITETFGAPLDYAFMLYIEVEDGYEALKDLVVSDLQIVVDGEPIAVDLTKVWTYESVGTDYLPNGNYCIEINNSLAGISLTNGSCIDPVIQADDSIVITFTLSEPAEEVPPTGDAIFAVLSILAVSGMGLTAVISKKK